MNRARRTTLVRVIRSDAPANDATQPVKSFRDIEAEANAEARAIVRCFDDKFLERTESQRLADIASEGRDTLLYSDGSQA